jgi:hypothetical protein
LSGQLSVDRDRFFSCRQRRLVPAESIQSVGEIAK